MSDEPDPEPPPTLTGERIRLRAPVEADIAARRRVGISAEVNQAYGGERTTDRLMTQSEAEAEHARRWGPGPHWTIADRADDGFVGRCRLAPHDAANRSARFAIGIPDPSRHGEGIGTEAATLAVEHGFTTMGLHRIELVVLAWNRRAIASYTKAGFEVEGRLRHTVRQWGVWRDDLIMSILNPRELTEAATPEPPTWAANDEPGPLRLRPLGAGDEAQFVAAAAELRAEGFPMHRAHDVARPWQDFLDYLERAQHRETAPSGLVPETWLGAFVDQTLVGTGSIRHQLNPTLLHEGGHIGYSVVPEHRRRGHATEILRQCLVLAHALGIEPVLVTCNDDNLASATVIERCGGVLDNVVTGRDGLRKRRYWIH